MDDQELHHAIGRLAEEQKRLREQATDGRQDPERRARLGEIEVRLDQLWDLLRRRQAREEFGQDPDAERVRAGKVVEHYRQ